ncbi:hypothetical protein [Mangrovicoccus sp. HB161399]|uniref:hypothetical protein n=1 Tax=Mangrovicoccus sp. HB161399 TaxID=2720392 RepID=UPI001557A3DE|nr:hypothetical protein [Mangrovicoccus sp. HB161399]
MPSFPAAVLAACTLSSAPASAITVTVQGEDWNVTTWTGYYWLDVFWEVMGLTYHAQGSDAGAVDLAWFTPDQQGTYGIAVRVADMPDVPLPAGGAMLIGALAAAAALRGAGRAGERPQGAAA